jgi:hypothetical protein
VAIDVAILSNEFLATITTSKNHSFDASGVGISEVGLFLQKSFWQKPPLPAKLRGSNV